MKNTQSLKILIVDDHALIRAGLRALLEKIDQIGDMAEANTGHEAIEKCARFHPDIILMDISMPDLNGLETAEILQRRHPEIDIIILSMYAEVDFLQKALEAGSKGYILKNADISEFEKAIREVAKGNIFISPELTEIYNNIKNNEPTIQKLTIRQRQVLQLLAEGKTSKEIGQKLNISPKTADAHRHNIMIRLNMNDLASLIHYAIRTGLVQSK